MESFTNSLVLLTSCTMSSVLAFGPRLEPLSHAYCCTRHSCRHASRLYASESEPDYRHDREESPRSHSSEFDFVSAPFDGLDDFSLLFDRGVFDGTFPMLQEHADALAFETLEENESLECEIPKAWCVPGETVDVMEFLGVTRVKPLC